MKRIILLVSILNIAMIANCQHLLPTDKIITYSYKMRNNDHEEIKGNFQNGITVTFIQNKKKKPIITYVRQPRPGDFFHLQEKVEYSSTTADGVFFYIKDPNEYDKVNCIKSLYVLFSSFKNHKRTISIFTTAYKELLKNRYENRTLFKTRYLFESGFNYFKLSSDRSLDQYHINHFNGMIFVEFKIENGYVTMYISETNKITKLDSILIPRLIFSENDLRQLINILTSYYYDN